ncbi:unnamed protein product [Sphagnum balticum]
MTWMKAAYHSYYGQRDINSDAVTTGKSKNQGGISGRRESAAALEMAINDKNAYRFECRLVVEAANGPTTLEGATEKDIVYAGIEEVMTQATNEVINTSLTRKVDLRTAAYINGINKLHEFYLLSGIPGCE